MYTYIIASLLSLIVLGCVFKNRERNSAMYFNGFLIFIIITFVAVFTVSLVRTNSLKTTSVTESITDVNQIVIAHDTLFFKYDTVRTATGFSVTIQKFDTKPDSIKNVKFEIQDRTVGAIFASNNLISGVSNDTVLVIFIDGELQIVKPCDIYEAPTSYLENCSVNYVGDNWTCGWSIPTISEYSKLNLCKSDIEYLEKTNPNTLKKWKIIR